MSMTTRYLFMTTNCKESTAMNAKKADRQGRALKAARPHPAYNDEISSDQIDAIRKLADPDGKRAAKRVVLYPSIA